MKKISLKIVLALLLSSTLFFSCSKEEDAVTSVGGCGTASASIVNDLPAYQAAVVAYQSSPTTANCNKVKSALTTIVNKVKGCPELTTTYEAFMKNFTCGS